MAGLERDSSDWCVHVRAGAHAAPNHLLLAHKGIERSDLQLQLTIDGTSHQALAFAKLAGAKTGTGSSLTLRNGNGSTLLSQIVSQVAKDDFDIVVIISPSPLTEDLRGGIETVCTPYQKAVLYLTFEELAKLFLEWKTGMEFEGRDCGEILRASAKVTRKAA